MTTFGDRNDSVFSLLSSAGMSPGEDSPDDRGRGAWALHQIQGDLPQPAHPARARGASQDLWSVLPVSAPRRTANVSVPFAFSVLSPFLLSLSRSPCGVWAPLTFS